jgi:hypothetical protein
MEVCYLILFAPERRLKKCKRLPMVGWMACVAIIVLGVGGTNESIIK